MKNTIIISDTHTPYHHRDTFSFLKAVKEEWGIEIAKHSGDFADNHFTSFHEIEYGTLSARDEYLETCRAAEKMSELFPKLTVVLGNHCIMSSRKAKNAQIPEDHLRSYNDLYNVNWTWTDKDYFKVEKGNNCLLTHAMSGNTLTNARIHSHSSIQGHFHGTYGIEYFADTETLRWSMTVGCLINPQSPAFNYAKMGASKRAIIGVGIIFDNTPILVPMKLTKTGRWRNRL